MMSYSKYQRKVRWSYPERTWPDVRVDQAPVWCSVDLRDGNQALPNPMKLDQKLELFSCLIEQGFKHIEIGFPAASQTEYDFIRCLIERGLVPDDVTIQVLTQARSHIIRRTFDALRGSKKAIVHLYNPISPIQRDIVLRMSPDEVIGLAVNAARSILELSRDPLYSSTAYTFEYSPESFSAAEPEFAVRICDAVMDVWQPDPDHKAIVNLPGTVEVSTPNIFADQVEYFCRHTRWRDSVLISLHTHNDRGTGVAAAELGLQAGADRIEGTLFGNGERTGNCDIVTMALNLLTEGINPQLDFHDINKTREIYEKTTGMEVPPRQPYAGDLVFTAFSGSHQDAIKKGVAAISAGNRWEVPYLPLDPSDIGRSYEPIIRINSQSGRSGAAFILEHNFGITLPAFAQGPFSQTATEVSEQLDTELTAGDLQQLLRDHFVNLMVPLKLTHYMEEMLDETHTGLSVSIQFRDELYELQGSGSGPVDAFCEMLSGFLGMQIEVLNFSQQALERGSQSRAMTYLKLMCDGQEVFAAGESSSSAKSSLRAVVSAVNRALAATADPGAARTDDVHNNTDEHPDTAYSPDAAR